jgi:hypothetical protein
MELHCPRWQKKTSPRGSAKLESEKWRSYSVGENISGRHVCRVTYNSIRLGNTVLEAGLLEE